MVSTKAALQKLWTDTCSVTEYQKVERPNGSTGFEDVVVLEDQPCKLSFVTLQTTSPDDGAARLAQVTKLFLDNAVEIKPGSKITVSRGGEMFTFKQSGLPGIFSSHQEIVLAPFNGWA